MLHVAAYREDLAHARLSDAAYLCPLPASAIGLYAGVVAPPQIVPLKSPHVRLVWAELQDRHIVCFRGTVHTRASWGLNFRLRLVRVPFGIRSRLHRGYLHETEQVYRALKGRLAGDKPIHLVGHSQGGALAQCLATQISRYQRGRSLVVRSFGQPKVGDAGYCRYLDQHRPFDIRRVVNIGDGFSLVPPRAAGYAHSQTPVYLAGNRLALARARFRFGPVQTARSHKCAVYIKHLADLAR